MKPRFEVCVETTAGAVAARAAGADRVELCGGLTEGGLTPSAGLIEATLRAVPGIAVHVLIRPRGGDFTYDRHERDAMRRDVALAVELGAQGVVLGALTPDGEVDVVTCRELVGAASGRSVTFHRAFDLAPRPHQALAAVVELGCDRLLTSGQERTALAGAPLLAELVRAAGDRLVVMPGGGITPHNVRRVLESTGASEVHFSGRTTVEPDVHYRNPRVAMASAPPEGLRRHATDPATVAAVISAAGPGPYSAA